MDEQHAAETELPTMINDDEFVENNVNNNDVGNELNNDDDRAKDTSSPSHPPHDKWIWLHAAFHCLVTMVVSRYNTLIYKRDRLADKHL